MRPASSAEASEPPQRDEARNRGGADAGAPPAPGLEVRDVAKVFGGVVALAGVSFALRPGRVHALLGENGAGKSTLLKILSGAHAPDRGVILIDGRPLRLAGPLAARQAGIAIIYQELSLVPWLSVAHNLLLGREREAGRVLLSRRRMRALARGMLARVGLEGLDPDLPVARLGTGTQQMIEIARSLGQSARFVLMDEPTAALSGRESETLFDAIRRLRAEGVGIAYISHRLAEIGPLADDITVLRDGAAVWSGPAAGITLPEIVRHMVGRPVGDHYPGRGSARGPEVLRVEPPPFVAAKRPIVVHAGEVVGLGGLVGAGRSEWALRLIGAAPPVGERVRLHGRDVRITDPIAAREAGLLLVPENRKEQGLVLARSVRQNIALGGLDLLARRLGLVDRDAERRLSRDMIARLRIRCADDRAEVATLSGGNQQKVVFAKWLARDGAVLVLDEPTRGIDVGARYEIYRLVNSLTASGKAVVLISSDLPELLSMSDRIYVMRGGAVVAELDPRRTTQEEVLRHAAGEMLGEAA